MLAIVVFTTTTTAVPQPVNTGVNVVEATRTIPTSTPTVAIVKKDVVQKPKSDCAKYKALIEKYDWSVETAMQICKEESQGDPKAINLRDSHKDSKGNVICVSSRGLMQIACIHAGKLGSNLETLLEPKMNLDVAYAIYEKKGWCPWTTYKGPGCD